MENECISVNEICISVDGNHKTTFLWLKTVNCLEKHFVGSLNNLLSFPHWENWYLKSNFLVTKNSKQFEKTFFRYLQQPFKFPLTEMQLHLINENWIFLNGNFYSINHISKVTKANNLSWSKRLVSLAYFLCNVWPPTKFSPAGYSNHPNGTRTPIHFLLHHLVVFLFILLCVAFDFCIIKTRFIDGPWRHDKAV